MTSTVFVTGGTGVLGRPAVRDLLASGRQVRALARSGVKAAQLRAAGAEAVEADLFDADAMKAATADCDAILHLATSIPRMRDARRADAWAMNARIRVQGTAILLDAARTHGIGTFVKESITFLYPDRGSQWIDESVELPGVVAGLKDTVDGERLVEQFTDEGGHGIVLRFGAFLAPDAHHMDDYVRLARRRFAPGPGRPGSYQSFIHVDDAATAVVAALAAPAGIYNVVDDEPLTRRQAADAFAAAFGFGHLFVVPAWLFDLLGGTRASYLLRSQRVSNAKLRAATGWAPVYPSAREALISVAAARAGACTETETAEAERAETERAETDRGGGK